MSQWSTGAEYLLPDPTSSAGVLQSIKKWEGEITFHSIEAVAFIYRLVLQSVPPLAEELSLCRLIRRRLNSSLLVRQRR